MLTPWKGIFVIVVTPFTKSLELDEDSLRAEIRFCIEAGAKGLVGPANASEFPFLTEDERRRWLEIVIGETRGQIPVVATTTAAHTLAAVALSKHAEQLGAQGIMAMPPHVVHFDSSGCYDYYRALNDAVNIPICVQNYPAPVGTPMAPDFLARLCRELPRVQYIKEETLPEPRTLGNTVRATGADCQGVFGGNGGIYLIDEFRRGAAGNMPACQATDVQSRMWDLLVEGKEDDARKLFNQILPLFTYERLYGIAVYKEVLHRRGIFATRESRHPEGMLDAEDRRELDDIMRDIEPLFTV